MSDLIDRQAALDALRRCQTYLYDARDPELKIKLSSAKAAINNLSTIQPEKAQLSQEGTTKGATSDLISRQAAIDGKISIQRTNGVEIYSDEAVPVEYLKNLPSRQPEPAIPLSWIEGKIEWLNNMDNYFAELTANVIKTMLNEWRKGEQDATN